MSSRAAGRCCAFVLAIAVGSQARGAAALESEPIALTLQFEGTAPCFTSAELATTIAERIGRPVANDAVDAQLALHVSVRQSGGSGFEVTIESRARDATEIGQRELTVAGGCDALAAPLSLVIALMVGSADAPQPPAVAPEAPATTPPPAPPAPTAPAVPPPAAPSPAKPATPAPLPRAPRADEPRSAGEGDPSSRFVLGLMGGADLSMVSETTRVIGVAARFEFGARAQSGALTRGAWEGAVEFLSSPEFDRGEWRASVDGAGAHGSLCGIWGPSWLAVEPCVGLWLRTLGVRGEGAAAELFEPSRETLFGWSTRAMLRSDVIGPWSVFGGIQALVPFGQHELSMSESERPPSQEAPGLDPPFFNMGAADRDPVQPAPTEPVRFELYEVPILAVVLLAGVTFTLP